MGCTLQKHDKLTPILEMIRHYLPKMEHIYTVGRVTDVRNKTVEQLRSLRDLGMSEISLGVESGDDWTLERINKGYHASDILEQIDTLPKKDVEGQLEIICTDIAARKTKEVKITPITKAQMATYRKMLADKWLRKDTALSYTVNESCIHCGICAKVCPANNITVTEDEGV